MTRRTALALATTLGLASTAAARPADVAALVAALLDPTPLEEDLRVLTDEIGGRATGSEANRRSVEWTLERFREAGVEAAWWRPSWTGATVARPTDGLAKEAGAAGVVVMASRPRDVLYRHAPSAATDTTLTHLVLEREAAQRALRLMLAGRQLALRAEVDAETGGPYESHNVIGEIRGSGRPDEIVLFVRNHDEVDLRQLRTNAAVTAALVWGLAEGEVSFGRQTPPRSRPWSSQPA